MVAPLIDTHAHLSFSELSKDHERIIVDAKASGIIKIINVAIGRNTSEIISSIEVSRKRDFVYNSIGIHPSYAKDFQMHEGKNIEKLISEEKPIAIGETGLDFYRPGFDREKQIEVFQFQIGLAKKHSLPLIIHQRDSFKDLMEILDKEKVFDSIKAVFHCFGGSEDEARQITDRGGYISITGIVTFKKADALRDVVSKIPLDRIMLETDCPYLAPEPKRGKRNEPSFVLHTAKEIARIRRMTFDELAEITTRNAISFFSL